MARNSRSDGLYVLPPPQGGVNTRVHPTSLAEGDYQMIRNIDVFSKLGAWATRPGTSLLNASTALGAIRGGIRFYYGANNSQLLLMAGTNIYRYDGGTTYTSIKAGVTDHCFWNFAAYNDILFIMNGVDKIQAWSGSAIRDAGYAIPGGAGAPAVAPGAAGVLTGAYQYAMTWVYNNNPGSESSSSGNSSVVNPAAQQVNVSGITIGGTGCTARNLYRTKVGGSLFYFLATINDNTTTTYTDNTADAALGTNQAPTDNAAPPAGAQFGVMWRGRLCLANTPGNRQRVYMSSTSNTELIPGGGGLTLHGAGPEIFPVLNFIDVGDDNSPITGLAVIQDRLVVFKQGGIYTIDGNDAATMQVFVAQAETGCIAPKTIVNMGGVLFFLGRADGVPTVYMFDGDRTEPLSFAIEPTFKSRMQNVGLQTQTGIDLQPNACRYRGCYMLSYVYQNGSPALWETAILDTRPPQPRWIFWDGFAPLCWIPWNGHGDSGQMYYGDANNGYVVQIDSGVQDNQTGAAVNIVATVTTAWLSFGKPHTWKQVESIEAYATALAGGTIKIDRYYNMDTGGIGGSSMDLSSYPVYTDSAGVKTGDGARWLSEVKAIQDCAGADNSTPDQGMLVQIIITITASASGSADIQKILVHYRNEPEDEVRRPGWAGENILI